MKIIIIILCLLVLSGFTNDHPKLTHDIKIYDTYITYNGVYLTVYAIDCGWRKRFLARVGGCTIKYFEGLGCNGWRRAGSSCYGKKSENFFIAITKERISRNK